MSNNFNLIHTRLEDLYGSDRMVLEYKKNHTSSTFSSDHNVAGFDVVFRIPTDAILDGTQFSILIMEGTLPLRMGGKS
jgi:hypothetical protein